MEVPNGTIGIATSATSETAATLNIPYTACEVVVAIVAVVGNLLVIIAFRRERRLRRRTNYYIVSLASADLLVGLLGIPCALLASVGLPTHKHACLFTVSLLVVLCTISIFCLVAVSVDRYWAILHPMGYSRNVRTKTAIGIICACWVAGSSVGFLPLMGWNNIQGDMSHCFFERVMAPQYLVFLYFATIIGPASIMAAFYTHIYTVVLKQLKQMVTVNGRSGGTHGSMLRVLGAARKREVKATQNLSIIVLFFMVCWIPLYTINFFQSFYPPWKAHPTVTMCCIILSHLNSAGNPLLYAYHLRDFRNALRSLLFGPPVEKVVGRDNTAYPETPTEQRERVKRANSASTLYRAPVGNTMVGNVLRGHRRSMTVPLYHSEGGIYKITGETYKLPQTLLELNLSCIIENSHSDEASKSLSLLGLQVTQTTLELQTTTPVRTDPPDTPNSPMGFMDDKTHDIYALGLVESPEANGRIYNVADVEDLGVGSEGTHKY